MNKVLPLDDMSELSISYLHQVSVRSQLIYILILLFTILALLSLPLIKVDISVKANGTMQPATEKNDIKIPTNGHISRINLFENMKVRAGDTLISIDQTSNKQQFNLAKKRIFEIESILMDISNINRDALRSSSRSKAIQNGQYKASWQKYKYELESAEIKCEQTEREYNRYNILYKKKGYKLIGV